MNYIIYKIEKSGFICHIGRTPSSPSHWFDNILFALKPGETITEITRVGTVAESAPLIRRLKKEAWGSA